MFFRLENGFFVDNGTNTTAAQPEGWAFQREAVLGIETLTGVRFLSAVSTP